MKYLIVIIVFIAVLVTIPFALKIPQTSAAYYAKEFCTCYFVLEQDEEFCHKEHASVVPKVGFELNITDKKVSSGLFIKSHAKFTGPKYGCLILQD